MQNYAFNAGAAVFRTWCAQCHGSGAAGAKGYPNLLDNDWLWGGDVEAIHQTIAYGVRSDHDDTRYSEMPAFGEWMAEEEIAALTQHVLAISGQEHDGALEEHVEISGFLVREGGLFEEPTVAHTVEE